MSGGQGSLLFLGVGSVLDMRQRLEILILRPDHTFNRERRRINHTVSQRQTVAPA